VTENAKDNEELVLTKFYQPWPKDQYFSSQTAGAITQQKPAAQTTYCSGT